MGKRFNNPANEAIEAEWKLLSTRQFTDYELEEFDVKLQRYGRLYTIADLERFYVDTHAARRQYGGKGLIYIQDEKAHGHLLVERVDNKISQWSAWRRRNGHTVGRTLDLDRSAAMHSIKHHDDFADFDVPELSTTEDDTGQPA